MPVLVVGVAGVFLADALAAAALDAAVGVFLASPDLEPAGVLADDFLATLLDLGAALADLSAARKVCSSARRTAICLSSAVARIFS